jgi:hypothetical protein
MANARQAKNKAPVFELFTSSQPDADTIECLELLLRRARRGEIIGLAYAAMLKKRAYIVDIAGVAHSSPTFARGMVAALDDQLADRIHGRD